MLASKTGMVLDDFPDIDLYQFFDEDFDEEEINDAAKECVSTILYDNGLD
jgi:tRNA nucleotidyltransferase (CCA-adding enzyme)